MRWAYKCVCSRCGRFQGENEALTGGATPQRLYQIKGRDAKVPLAVCVADAKVWRAACCVQEASDAAGTQDVARYARIQHLPRGFLEQLLPGTPKLVVTASWRCVALASEAHASGMPRLAGPVTLVLDRLPATLSDSLNPGVLRIGAPRQRRTCLDSWALRMADCHAPTATRHPGAGQALHPQRRPRVRRRPGPDQRQPEWHAQQPDGGRVPPPVAPGTCPLLHAIHSSSLTAWPLPPQCACVFDGGQMPPDRRGSTVVDLSQAGTYCIIREGSALALVSDAATRAGLSQRTE